MGTIFFLIFAIVAVVCAFMVILQKHPIGSALALVGVMGSLAVLYLMLGAEFIAMAQMIVYGGAIMVLFIFVIMLLNAGTEKSSTKSWFAQIAGLPLLLAFAGVIGFFIWSAVPNAIPNARGVVFGDWVEGSGTAANIGAALFTQYLLPFEIVSILILIAILGAVVLARKEID
jgi:NADH-quinone oxidoreductase subunit J